MLHHPIYAGAYRWGHREVDPRKKVPGRPTTGRTFNAHDACRVLIRDRFPAYITWERIREQPAETGGKQHAWARCSPLPGMGQACWPGWSSAAGAATGCSSATANADGPARRYVTVVSATAIDYGADSVSKLVGRGVGIVRRRAAAASRLARVAGVEPGRDRGHRTRAKATRRSLAAAAGAVALRSRTSAAAVRGGRSRTSSGGSRVGTPLGRSAPRRRTVAGRLRPLPARLPDAAFAARARTDSGVGRKTCPRCGMPTQRRPKIAKRSPGCCWSKSP